MKWRQCIEIVTYLGSKSSVASTISAAILGMVDVVLLPAVRISCDNNWLVTWIFTFVFKLFKKKNPSWKRVKFLGIVLWCVGTICVAFLTVVSFDRRITRAEYSTKIKLFEMMQLFKISNALYLSSAAKCLFRPSFSFTMEIIGFCCYLNQKIAWI